MVILNLSFSHDLEFLTLRKVPFFEKPLAPNVTDVLPSVREMMLKDRDFVDKVLLLWFDPDSKSQIAFVSFIRAYKEHHCSYIFRLSKLDVGKLAVGFGMLQVEFLRFLINLIVT